MADDFDLDLSDVAASETADDQETPQHYDDRQRVESARQQRVPSRTRTGILLQGHLYFDLETVPDWQRVEMIEELPPREKIEPSQDPELILNGTVVQVKQWLKENGPLVPLEFLTQLAEQEQKASKPRSGVTDAIQQTVKSLHEADQNLRRKYATMPETCRIVAAGWASGSDSIEAVVIEDYEQEEAFLEHFWMLVEEHQPLVGYNHIAFDLPVIMARSAALAVPPSRRISLAPFNNADCLDLMVERFGRSKAMPMKDLATLMGFSVPAGDTDGSEVEELWQNDPESLKEYVRSDVAVTRKLHLAWSGYFLA